jgi:TolB-like protein/AraC-like DNA-binding protein/Tfp pilus assembly protein PilF
MFIDRLSRAVESNLEIRQFGVEDLAREIGMSRSLIYRKLQSISGRSVSQFIRDIRLGKAMELLEQNSGTVSEIAYRVGFGSPAYFNTCFHERYGYPPGEVKYRNLQKGNKKSQFSYKHFLIFFSILLILPISFMASRFFFNPVSMPDEFPVSEKSIAILPFKNLSDDPESKFFTFGIADDILNHLAGIKDFKTISRTSSENYTGNSKSMPQIGRELGADFILEGSVQKYGDQVRIIVQLVEAGKDKHIWSEEYDVELKDILQIQSKIAKQIATELNSVISQAEIEKLGQFGTQNIKAHNLYIKGRYFWNNRTLEGLNKSIEYYSKAIEIDPEYSYAYAGLADTYLILAIWGNLPPMEGYPKVKEFALKALSINNSVGEAHATLAEIFWRYEGSLKLGEMQYKRAIEMVPNYATAHQWYAEYLWCVGRKEEARKQINIAKELDPLSKMIYQISANQYCQEGLLTNALSDLEKIIEMDPDFVPANYELFFIYRELGMPDQAVAAFKKVTHIVKDPRLIDEIYKRSGLDGILFYLIDWEKQKDNPNYRVIAEYYAILGQKEKTLYWLEKLLTSKYWIADIISVRVNRHFLNYKADPEFQRIFGKIEMEFMQSD